MKIEFLWFRDCPNHKQARALLFDVLGAAGVNGDIEDIDASDLRLAEKLPFPGSPTIRINGTEIEPGFVDSGEYAPRCRLYQTEEGLRGLPERAWLEEAVRRAPGSN